MSIDGYLRDQIRAFEESYILVSARPKIKSLKRLRVSLRRLRTVLAGFEAAKIPTLSPRQKKNIQRLWKLSGQLRDLQVVRALAEKRNLNHRHLDSRLKSSRRKLRRYLGETKINVLLLEIELLLLQEGETPLDFRPFSRSLTKALKMEAKTLEELHEFRIALKKARYVLEARGESVQELKPYQDELGELNDLDQLRKYFPDNKKILSDLATKEQSCRRIIPLVRSLVLKRLHS